MEIVDCHSHSALSGHGEGSIGDAVRQARDMGLTTYVQTEHLVLPAHLDPHYLTSMATQTMALYIIELEYQRQRLAEEGSDMELIIGIEADWLDNRTEELKNLCKPFEYVIGSLHYLDEWACDDADVREEWFERGVDEVWKRYFEVWLEMAASDAPFTTYGHPDLPKKFGDRPSFDTTEYFAAMAEATAKKGRMIEVNTAGLRKPVREMYPSIEALRLFCEAGVDCTVGSDAHSPVDIGRDIDKAYAAMKQAGYDRVAVPTRDGDRRYISLKE